MVANFDRSTRKLLNSSKSNPCPVCGRTKDFDCRISHDGKMVLCHQNFDHIKTQQPDLWHFDGTSSDNRCGVYVFKERTTKDIRPKQTRSWEYPDRNGSRLIRVMRFDDGEGNKKIWQEHWDGSKWQKGIGDVARANIPVYRYAEIREAIAQGEPIYTVEGEPCADLLWKLGLAATTNIGGGGKFTLTDSLDLQGSKVIVIVPDRDKKGVEHTDKLAEHFPDALWLYPFPESKVWANLPKDHGLDVADWIEHHKITADDIKGAIGTKKILQQPADLLQRSFDQESTGNNSPAKSKNKRLLNLIGARWGERLRMNEMSLQIEMDGKEINIEQVYFRMAEELDIDVSKQKASDLVITLAKKNTYSPVRDYLDSLAKVTPIDLNNLAERYFGTSDPLHQTLLKRTLIAGVARVYEPGCKHDTLCILQGGQGFLKSTFLKELAGKAWFTDNLNDANEKDEKLKLRRYWALEYSEFETAFKRKEVEQLKAFLSSPVDSLRVPYGKSIEDFPRTSIFVGSTNRQEFLHDPTGERRYWVIPVKQRIPVKLVESERDAIWAAAVAAYRNGEQWWLTPEEDNLLAEANKGWQSSDVWETNILSYLEFRETCTVGELLEKVIGMDLAQQKKAEQMRVSDILRCCGWMKATKRIDGKLQKCWERVVTGGNEVVTEVVTPQNPLSVSISEVVLPPVTTSNSNFSKNIDLATQNIELAAESDGIEKNKTFETLGGNTLAATSETPTEQEFDAVTTSLLPPLIKRVKTAQTWAECEAIWGDDLELKEKIKSQLTQNEYRRIGKLLKQASIDSPPIALPDKPAPAETPIEDLHLSIRPYNCLKRAKIDTIKQLIIHTPQSLLELNSMGQSSADEIVDRLQKLGFSLASEVIEDVE